MGKLIAWYAVKEGGVKCPHITIELQHNICYTIVKETKSTMKSYRNIDRPSPNKVRAELASISCALHSKAISPDRYRQLYAMQQALTWVTNPNVAMPPYKTVMTGKIF